MHLAQEEVNAFSALAAELNELAPAFVVATGDLVDEGNGATVSQADKWFDLYENVASTLNMPLYNVVGNHDVVGIGNQGVASTDPGYGEGIFISRFGPTYYSFDWGKYHCIVLDPNDLVDGKQVYQISDTQLRWLKDDLKHRGSAPVLVFFHEPTANWRNRSEVLKVLKGRSAELFCGHLHQDIMTDATDVSEQITGAVCGEWWHGANPDGKPAGYRIVAVKGDEVDSLYKGTGDERTIDPGLMPIVNGQVDLAVKIHSVNSLLDYEVTYRVDDGQPATMYVETSRMPSGLISWDVATASWDTASLSEGYHQITFTATDSNGSFEKRVEVKVSDTETVSASDLTSHWSVYQGSYVSVEGSVDLVLIGGPSSLFGIPEGIGLLMISDGKDRAVVVAGECFSPPLDDYKAFQKHEIRQNGQVRVKVVPMRLSMDFLKSTREYGEYYSQIEGYVDYLPSSAQEKDAHGKWVAVWGARWLSADDLTNLSE
jgi:Icc protein